MSNAIVKISKRAKAIQRANKNKAWKSCIKQASTEYRAGKLGTTATATKYRQTGSSVKKYDRLKKAKPPGKRKSATGKTYYERRKNRSDVPGSLSGAKKVLRDAAKERLKAALLAKEMATTKMLKRYFSKKIREAKADLKKYS